MNCIDYCVKRILSDVNRNLLERAFKVKNDWNLFHVENLESIVEREIIRDYLMVDMNVISGQPERIPIHALAAKQLDNALIYNIPLSLTHGRRITAAHSIESGPMDSGLGSTSASVRMAHASMGVQAVGTARLEIKGPNVVAVYEDYRGTYSFLNVTLEHDENLANINPRAFGKIADMAILAAKHLIHVKIGDSVGDGDNLGGAGSDNFRATLDRYADAKETYDELKDKLQKIILVNDRRTHNKIIRMGISGL